MRTPPIALFLHATAPFQRTTTEFHHDRHPSALFFHDAKPSDDTADDGDAGDPVIVLPPGSQEARQRQLWTQLEALEVTGWTPGDDAGALAARIVEGLVAECPSEPRTWAPGLLAVAVLAADSVRQKLRDESWAQVAALAAEWNAADAALCAAKAYGVIWNRLSDRAALDQAIHWAGFAAGLAKQTGWKAAARGYQHALLLSQRAATHQPSCPCRGKVAQWAMNMGVTRRLATTR